jgi:hypothetical protein|tara:strand:- start:8318 stop:8737 length:420 start_codon:yes stop_codon:yes gene_type:complete
MLEIPDDISPKYISDIKRKCCEIDDDVVLAISSIIDLKTDGIDISDDIDEDDLFHLGEDILKLRRAAIELLEQAVDQVLYPAMNSIRSSLVGLKRKDLAYIDIKGSRFVVTGMQKSYYSKSDSEAYEYILALNISKILD